MCAYIHRIDHAANELRIDEQFKGLGSAEAFAEKLDETEPRYLLYIHKVVHRDGRTSYPIAFLVFMPETMPPHLKVMYTRPVVTLTDTFKVRQTEGTQHVHVNAHFHTLHVDPELSRWHECAYTDPSDATYLLTHVLTSQVPKHIPLEDAEDLTDEWLEEKLGVVK